MRELISFMRRWLKSSKTTYRADSSRRRCRRLTLELLESRVMPALGTPAWLAQGPAPIVNPNDTFGSPNDGAVNGIAADPANANNMFIATVNGGVWKTTNATSAAPTWTPLTDQAASLATSDVTYAFTAAGQIDPNTLYASTGAVSSANNVLEGGRAVGVYKITNALSATPVISAPLGGDIFGGVTIIRIVSIPVAGAEGAVALTAGGLFRTINGGTTWNQVNVAAGVLTDLVRDPQNASRLYAAVAGVGVFVSNNAGATWAPTNNAQLTNVNTSTRIRLAVSGNAIFAGMLSGAGQDVSGVLRSVNQGATWTAMAVPRDANGAVPTQRGIFFALAADPTNSNIVYVAGDAQPAGASGAVNSCRILRGDASQPAATQWSLAVGTGANNTGPAADARQMVFDAAGNLLDGCDGGIYRLNNPKLATHAWASLDSNLQATEFYALAYDSVNRVLVGGAQDNSTPRENSTGSKGWTDQTGGDGGITQTDNVSQPGFSIEYVSSDTLGNFSRITFNANNQRVDRTPIGLQINGTDQTLMQADTTVQFIQPFVLDAVAPTRMLLGTNFLYESTNQGDTLTRLNGGADVGRVRAMAYGGRLNGVANPDVAYVGTEGANPLLLRTTAGGAFTPLAAYAGAIPLGIALDPDNWRTAYIVDSDGRVWRTADAGASFTQITGNLGTFTNRTVSITVFGNTAAPNDEAVFIGGLGGVFGTDKPTAGAGTTWARFGTGMPNVLVSDVRYEASGNLLIAATLGRGAWTVSNLSSFAGTPAPAISLNDGISTNYATTFTPNGGAIPVESPFLSLDAGTTATLAFAVVSITNLRDGANEVLAANTTGTAIAANYTASTGILRLIGTDSVANYRRVLRTVTYNNTSNAPNTTARVIMFRVSTGTVNSNQPVTTLTFKTVANAPPAVDLGGDGTPDTTARFAARGPAVPIGSPNLVVKASVPNLTGAQITITDLRDGAEESLAATTTGTNITALYDPATGVLTLSGDDTTANYEQVLRTVVYDDNDASPTEMAREITVQLMAGTTQGAIVESTLFIDLVNNAPILNNAEPFKLSPILRNNTNNMGNTVDEILDSLSPARLTDADLGALHDIVVVGVDDTNGTWQFTTDSGQTWEGFEAPSATESRLLENSGDTRIRFVPNADFTGTATFTFRGWDQTSGPARIMPEANGEEADTTINGGSTSFSSAVGTAIVSVVGQAVFVRFGSDLWEHVGTDKASGWSLVWAGSVTQFSPSLVQANTVYVSFGGAVWEHVGTDSTTGWSLVWGSGITDISAGVDQGGSPTAFVSFGGVLWEHAGTDANTGWSLVWDSGVTQFSASQGQANTVYVNFGGTVWEHTGTDKATGWSLIWAGSVTDIKAAPVNDTAYVNFGGALWEHVGIDSNTGWTLVRFADITAVSVSPIQADTVFVVYGGAAWEHTGKDSTSGWIKIWDSLVIAVSASPAQNDTTFAVFTDGTAWLHIGTDSTTGWFEIWTGVTEISAGL